jgi:hypothetical protein
MTTWEYHKASDDTQLNELGSEGWELVAVTSSGAEGAAVFYFKRPALTFREQVTEDQKRHYYALKKIKPPREEGEAR